MTYNHYCLLIAKGNLKPLREKFYEQGGFYNGVGYAFPAKNEEFVQQILSALPEAKILKLPIGIGQTLTLCVNLIRLLFSGKNFTKLT